MEKQHGATDNEEGRRGEQAAGRLRKCKRLCPAGEDVGVRESMKRTVWS